MNPQSFTPEDEASLREVLKRCSPETINKAIKFRQTGDANLVGDVVIGIIERFVEPERRGKLDNAPDTLVVAEELGLDSLTMVEVVLAVEDATGATVGDDEVQKLRTLGDIKNFIKSKVSQ